MPTEPQLLDEQALAEIERRGPVTNGWQEEIIISPSERDALCATVRAAWAERQTLRDDLRSQRNQITALREQLAQQLDTLTSCDSVLSYIYHRERSRLLPATQEQVLDTMREVEKITRRKP